MNESDYEQQQEDAAAGQHVAACMAAIFDEWQPAHSTLASLQRRVYKDTDAGISLFFALDDGTFVWVGSPMAEDPTLVSRVKKIGFSSIVEGSEAEVPVSWLNLLDDSVDRPSTAVSEFERLAAETSNTACELWAEANKPFEPTPQS